MALNSDPTQKKGARNDTIPVPVSFVEKMDIGSAQPRGDPTSSPPMDSTQKNIIFTGPTGSGKSTIIKAITKNEEIKIGHTAKSETQRIESFSFGNLSLFDTPGLGDSEGKDQFFLDKMVDTLQECGVIHKLYFCISAHETRWNSFLREALTVLLSLFPKLPSDMVKIVFTHCDEIRDMKALRQRWSGSELKNEVIYCGLDMHDDLVADMLKSDKPYQTEFMMHAQTLKTQLTALEGKIKASQENEAKLNGSIKKLRYSLESAVNEKDKLAFALRLREEMECQVDEMKAQVTAYQEKCRDLEHQLQLKELERTHVTERYQENLVKAKGEAAFKIWDAVPIVGALVRIFQH